MNNIIKNPYIEYIPFDGTEFILYVPDSDKFVKINTNAIHLLELSNTPQSIDELVKSYTSSIEDSDRNSTELVVAQMLSIGALLPSGENISPPSSRIGLRNLSDTIPQLVLHVTLRCNLACSYCYSNKYRKTENVSELTDTQWKEIIDQAVVNGCKTVYITGGEPLLREDLLPVWSYAMEQGIYTKLLTNGTLITKNIAEQIKKSISELIISIDSIDPCINDMNRGKGSYKRILHSIAILKEIGVSWQGQIVVNRKTMSTLKETTEWLKELSGKHPVLAGVISSHDNDDESEEAFSAIDGLYANSNNEYNPDECLEFVSRCGAANTIVSISPDGYLYPCKGLMVDRFKGLNILETGLKKARDASPNLIRFRNVSYEGVQVCSSCSLIKFCMAGGCRARAYMRTGSIFGYIGDTVCRAMRRRITGKISNAVLKAN
ncbi:MAG: radical SAM protein [Candidatus Sabulitectum sp.]|nr:radical SAM protein [Candidatus Sabulitectum sp.]